MDMAPVGSCLKGAASWAPYLPPAGHAAGGRAPAGPRAAGAEFHRCAGGWSVAQASAWIAALCCSAASLCSPTINRPLPRTTTELQLPVYETNSDAVKGANAVTKERSLCRGERLPRACRLPTPLPLWPGLPTPLSPAASARGSAATHRLLTCRLRCASTYCCSLQASVPPSLWGRPRRTSCQKTPPPVSSLLSG